ncbi:aspartate--tRNA ligase, partial [Patescibacteria group bacterium]|nr:aspartate--tRNA ligase [Patescibacteria group bacterium]
HGKIIFLDLRDASGIVQVVATPKADTAYKIASSLGSNDVIKVVGTVNERPDENINTEIPTGKIEVIAQQIKLINKAQALPIPTEGDGYDIEEAARFKNRYIDLRRPRLQENLKLRHRVTQLVREFLDKKAFIEIETPYLSKTTPEGARDFLVPSRLQKGKFYALAQSPQQYKQLLMISGFERYYQLARAFRDEDLRADRQFEHTQIDIEMAFVDREDVMSLVEEMIIYVVEGTGQKIDKNPFPILTFKEAKDKYNTDRPNLAKSKEKLHFLWVKDFPLFEKTTEGKYTFAHNPFASPKTEGIQDLKNKNNLDSLHSLQYDLVCNGEEIGGGSIRISDPEIQKQIFRILGYSETETEKQFGHLLSAYKYGAPIHGGIALGLDRLVALIAGENNIREVIAFPVTSGGQTSVMDAPSTADTAQLKELGIKLND